MLHMRWRKVGRKPSRDDLTDRLNLWCERWAPDVSVKTRCDVAREVLRRPRLDSADQCAARLRLSYAERTRLRITTIGSYDLNKQQRAKRKKQRKLLQDRKRAAMKRVAGGRGFQGEVLGCQPVRDAALEGAGHLPADVGTPPRGRSI